MRKNSVVAALFSVLFAADVLPAADDSKLTSPESPTGPAQADRERIEEQQQTILRENPAPSEQTSNAVDIHSRRGDAFFFLNRPTDAVREYQAMVRLRPELDASHWRLGIAYFFAGNPEDAAAQFDRYHSFDQVDRENGIWRFLSHHRAFGATRARRELLRYDRDDREPFPAVYRMFDGSLTPEEALAEIPSNLPKQEREKRLFYTELYIGMLHSVRGEHERAIECLAKAVSREWPRRSGFGPAWMWHVARLEHDRIRDRLDQPAPEDAPEPSSTPDAPPPVTR